MRLKTAMLIGGAGVCSWLIIRSFSIVLWQVNGSLAMLTSVFRVVLARTWAPAIAGLLVAAGLMALALEYRRLSLLKASMLMVATALSAVWLIYLKLS